MTLAWLIFVALVVLFVQSAVYRYFGMKRLEYSAYFSKMRVYEGQEVEMVERIENRKWLPVPWVRLEATMDVHLRFAHQANLEIAQGQLHQNHRSIFGLMSHTRITRRHRVLCSKRGWYKLTSASMTTGDLFGMHSGSRSILLSAEVLVYPKVVPIDGLPLPAHRWLGEVAVRRWIVDDPFLIAGVRQYQATDAFNQVNWKATARTGQLQVHKRDFTADHRLVIYVNFEDSEGMWAAVSHPERIEHGLSVAASILHHAAELGVETGFGCNGYITGDVEKRSVRTSVSSGNAHLEELLATMARLEIAASTGFYALLEEDIEEGVEHRDYLIITTYTNQRMEGLMRQLRALGNAVDTYLLEEPGMRTQGDPSVRTDHGPSMVDEGAPSNSRLALGGSR